MAQSDSLNAHTETAADEMWPYPLGKVIRLYSFGQRILVNKCHVLNDFSLGLFSCLPQVNNFFDDAGWKLLLAMGLPLIDGVFPSIVLSGGLSTVSGLLVAGATIFGGPWMLTVIFDEMNGNPVRVRLQRVAKVAGIVIPVAGIEAVVAPTIASILHIGMFQVFSGLVIFTVGASIANDHLASVLVPPKYILTIGFVSSIIWNAVESSAITPEFVINPILVAQALGAASIATGIATIAAILGPSLDNWLDTDSFEVGAGIALALVPMSIAGLIPSLASIAVFVLAIVFSLTTPSST